MYDSLHNVCSDQSKMSNSKFGQLLSLPVDHSNRCTDANHVMEGAASGLNRRPVSLEAYNPPIGCTVDPLSENATPSCRNNSFAPSFRASKACSRKEVIYVKDCLNGATQRSPPKGQDIDDPSSVQASNLGDWMLPDHSVAAARVLLGGTNAAKASSQSASMPAKKGRNSVSFGSTVIPSDQDSREGRGVLFDSNFECGNLLRAERVIRQIPLSSAAPTASAASSDFRIQPLEEYLLYMEEEPNRKNGCQWFCFRTKFLNRRNRYSFSFCNFYKSKASFTKGMRPVFFSSISHAIDGACGWKRIGDDMLYRKNAAVAVPSAGSDSVTPSAAQYTLSFTFDVPHDNDICYFAFSVPYSLTRLQSEIIRWMEHPAKSQHLQVYRMCRTVAGNSCPLLRITDHCCDYVPLSVLPWERERICRFEATEKARNQELLAEKIKEEQRRRDQAEEEERVSEESRIFFVGKQKMHTSLGVLDWEKDLDSNPDAEHVSGILDLQMPEIAIEKDSLQVPDEVPSNSDPVLSGRIHRSKKLKPVIVMSARVHPGETVSSFMCEGLIEYLLSDSPSAARLREQCVFVIVPMLNPDGVVNGFYRTNLAGTDLNRCWDKPSELHQPTVHTLKAIILDLQKSDRIISYFDFHGHSHKKGIFFYGTRMYPSYTSIYNQIVHGAHDLPYSSLLKGSVTNRRHSVSSFCDSQFSSGSSLAHQTTLMSTWKPYRSVSPVDLVLAVASMTRLVNLKHCTAAFPRVARFRGVARYVVSEELAIPLSFTVEASFHCGTHGPYKRRHFRTFDYIRFGQILGFSIYKIHFEGMSGDCDVITLADEKSTRSQCFSRDSAAATKPEIFDFSDNDIFLRPSDDDEQYIDYVKECSGDFKSRWYASISNVPEEQDDSDDNEDDSESSGVKLTTCDGNVEEKFIASQNVSSVTSRLNEMRLPHIRYYTNITGATEAMMDSCREFGGTGDLKVADVESSRDATLSGPQATLGLGIQVSQAVTSESYAACVEQQIEDTINVSNAVAIATEMGSPLVLTPDWASKDTISIDGHRTAADEITGIDTKLLVKKQTISGFSCDATVSRPLLQQSTDDRRSSNSSAEETLEIVAAQIFSGTLRLPNSTKKPVQVHRQNSAMSQSSTKIISFDSPQRSVPIVESGQVILINVDISDCHSMASPILQLEGKQLTEQMQMKKITAVPECELKKNGLSDTGNILPVESVNESATAVISAGQPTKQGNRLMDVLNIGAIPAPPNQSRASSRPHPKRDMPFLSSSLSPTTNVMQCIEHNIQKLCDQEVSHDTSSQCPDGDKFNLSKLNNVEFIFPDSATGDGSIASNPVSMCDSTQTAFAKHVEKLTAERLCSPLVPELGQHVAPVATTPRPSSTIFDFRPATAASSTSPNLKNRVHRNLSESGKRSIAIVGDMQCTDTTDGPDLSAAFFAAGSSLGVPVTRSVPARKSSINSTSLAKPARLQTKWSHVKGAAHNLLHNSKELGSPIVSQSFKINSTATADVEEVCLLPNSDLKNKEVSDSVNAQDINEIKRDTAPLQDTEVEIPFNIHSSGHFCVEATRLSAAVQSMSVNPSNAILKSFSRIACESKVTKAILPSVCVDFDDEIFDNESNECNHLNIMRYARCTQDISPRISESHYRYCAELDGVSQQPLEKITSLDSTDAIIRVVVKDSKSPQLSFRPGKNNNQLNSELSVDYPLDPSDRPINGSIAEPATALEGQGSNNLPHVNFSMTTDTLHRTFGSKPSVYAVSDPTKEEQRHVSSKNQKQATRIRLALKNSL